ncbi:MAG: 2-oxoglutarate dehydrogenase, E2 component, dihydrolipoamide succinyltransferase, partial [Phycisphaerae bacterium]
PAPAGSTAPATAIPVTQVTMPPVDGAAPVTATVPATPVPAPAAVDPSAPPASIPAANPAVNPAKPQQL